MVTADTEGRTELTAISVNTTGEADTAYAYYVVPIPVEDAPRPAGVDEGITYNPNDHGKVTLSLLAPYKNRVYVIGEFNEALLKVIFLVFHVYNLLFGIRL